MERKNHRELDVVVWLVDGGQIHERVSFSSKKCKKGRRE